MARLFGPSGQLLIPQDATAPGQFMNAVELGVLECGDRILHDVLKAIATDSGVGFRILEAPAGATWSKVSLGRFEFMISVATESMRSALIIKIFEYNSLGTRSISASCRIGELGALRRVQVTLPPALGLDPAQLAGDVANRVASLYREARVDVGAALRSHGTTGHFDAYYDVLRRSTLREKMLANISLYSVCKGLGRHMPALDRTAQIVRRIAKGLPHQSALCPLRLALDMYLTPLDGRRYELYTQRAFRDMTPILARSNSFTGESYVRWATECFFDHSDVIVQPLVSSAAEDLLLSAIYPAILLDEVSGVLHSLRPDLEDVLRESQGKQRGAFERLDKWTTAEPVRGPSWAALAGEFVMSAIKTLPS